MHALPVTDTDFSMITLHTKYHFLQFSRSSRLSNDLPPVTGLLMALQVIIFLAKTLLLKLARTQRPLLLFFRPLSVSGDRFNRNGAKLHSQEKRKINKSTVFRNNEWSVCGRRLAGIRTHETTHPSKRSAQNKSFTVVGNYDYPFPRMDKRAIIGPVSHARVGGRPVF